MSTTSSTSSASFDDASAANETTVTEGAIVPSPSRRNVSFRLNDPRAANYGNLSSSRRLLVEQRLSAAQGRNFNHNGPHGENSMLAMHPAKGGPQLKDDSTSISSLVSSPSSRSNRSNDYSFTIDDEDDRKPAAKSIVKMNFHPSDGGPQLQDVDSRSVSTFAASTASSFSAASAARSTLLASEDDDIETGKMAKRDPLSKTSQKMPTATATVVASLPHPDDHVRASSDRDVAAIANANNLDLVEAKLVNEEEVGKPPAKKSKKKKKMRASKVASHPDDIEEPKRYCFNTLKRRGCIGLAVLAILLIIVIIVISIVAVPKSSSSSTNAVRGSNDNSSAPTTTSTTSDSNNYSGSDSQGNPVESDIDISQIPIDDIPEEDIVQIAGVDLTPIDEIDQERMASFKRIIEFYQITPLDVLENKNTAQYAALDWLANKDSGSTYSAADDVRVLQRYVLATLYYSTGGMNWDKQYNFLSEDHECEWFEEEKDWMFDMSPTIHGIKCGDGEDHWFDNLMDAIQGKENEHIVEIRLDSNNLDGPLPSEVNALFLLQGLYLGNNKLRSRLDPDTFDAPNLKEVELQNNEIFAKIPPQLPATLEKLDMHSNRLVGTIPEGIWSLQNLRYLNLGNNEDLTGSIGENVGEQRNLEVINLNDVDLEGTTLPMSLKNLNIKVFEVVNCGLTGDLPDIFASSNDLQIADLQGNNLEGSIPVSLSSMHPSLTSLNFENNSLSGPLPDLTNNFLLQSLRLANNSFSGPIPLQYNQFLYLSTLSLHENNLTGDVDGRLCFVKTITVDPDVGCNCCSNPAE